MKVKICGVLNIKTAEFAIEQGADALGFVFAASKRRITPEGAKEIIGKLPGNVWKVGVFVNEQQEIINEIVKEVGLNVIQLHGDESPKECEGFLVPVIKAFSITTKTDLLKISEYQCDYVLLDSPKGKYHGGNGVRFDWSLLHQYYLGGKNIILAGGLNAENIQNAIKQVNPFMVDVSSGVETEGTKDLLKIQRFIERAKDGRRFDESI